MIARRNFLAASAAALAAPPLRLSAQAPIRLVVATAPIDGAIGPLVGLRGGFFKNHGLEVELRSMSSGAAMAAAVAGGSLHVAATNILGLISAHVKGIPFQIIAPGGLYVTEQPAEMLVVRKDAAIRTAADLNQKTIASSALGDLDSVAALAWIDLHGGDSKTVRRVEISPAATQAALEAGRIDAAGLQEPRLSEALQSGNIRVLGKMYDAIGKRFTNAHPDQTARWLAEFANADVDLIQRTPRKIMAESMDLALIQPVLDAAVRAKVIERGFDLRELISPIIRNAAA